FFQAEDGIRDPLVTGVQTCALPISGVRMPGGTSMHEMGINVFLSLLLVVSCCSILGVPLLALGIAVRDAELNRCWYSAAVVKAQIGRASCRERVEVWCGGM